MPNVIRSEQLPRMTTEHGQPLSRPIVGAKVLALGACLWAVQALGPCAAASADQSPTLEKIRATGVISIGYREGSVPFSYLDSNHQPVGYSMDICNRVVVAIRTRLGLRTLDVRLTPMTPATRIPLVANGTIDLECGVTTNTRERQKSVAFSVTTFVTESRLVSKRELPVMRVDDMRRKAIVTTIGTTSMRTLNELNQSRHLDMEILAGRDDADSFLMVASDRAQAYAMDDVLLRSFVANAPRPADYVISHDILSVEPYGIMLNKDDPVFKRTVDAAIVGLFRRGEIHDIYRRWFEKPIPGQGINLRLPMSEALRRVVREPTDSADPEHYR